MTEDYIEYEVEKILGKRTINGKIEYKVKWLNYPLEESTWEPITNLDNSKEMVRKFEHSLSKKNIIEETIYEINCISNISIKSILSIQSINSELFAVVAYKEKKEQKCKKGILRTSILKKYRPILLIDYYERNAKFSENYSV